MGIQITCRIMEIHKRAVQYGDLLDRPLFFIQAIAYLKETLPRLLFHKVKCATIKGTYVCKKERGLEYV